MKIGWAHVKLWGRWGAADYHPHHFRDKCLVDFYDLDPLSSTGACINLKKLNLPRYSSGLNRARARCEARAPARMSPVSRFP